MVITILNIPVDIKTYDTIFLGRPEDNLSRTFHFDISEWVDTFGVGEVRLRVNRPGENFSYIANIVLDSNIASWTIEEADVAISGIGAIELQYVVGKTKIKSQKFRTEIGDCIRGSLQETPLPGQSYMSQVFETANDIMNSVSIAKEAADRAEDAAEKAENGGEAFIATYGKTTFEELTEAWEAGKALFCLQGAVMYALFSATSNSIAFYNIVGYNRNTRICTTSGWKTLQQTTYCAESHATQHVKGGADPITPVAIGALAGYIRAMYDGEDTDDLTTPGDYSCSNAVAKTIKNAAFNVSHFIRVISFSDQNIRLVQEAYEQNSSSPHRKWRVLTATGWSEWIEYSCNGGSFTETDPTVPNWAKQSQKPKYTASEVGAYTIAQTQSYVKTQTESIKSDVEGLQQQLNEEAHFRGYLSTNAKIQELEATPNDFAYSAESGTKWVYDAENGWQDTGAPVPDQLTPASYATPLVDGIAHPGTSNEYARGDHRHPTDTTRASAEELLALKSDVNAALDAIIAIQNELIGGDGS